MSKVYTLTGSLSTGLRNYPYWSSESWVEFSTSPDTWFGNIGLHDNRYLATSMMFDAATLTALRAKTVTAMSLTLNIVQGANGSWYLGYKYNSTVNGSASSQAWARSDSDSQEISSASQSVAATYYPSAAGTMSIDLTGKAVPKYGFVAGPPSESRQNYHIISGATLYVTTNETDYTYTLSYNANGGSNAPANQTGNNTRVSPSYTFTIADGQPTRTGYTFSGWSTTAGGSVEYVAGDTITIDSTSKTLYAVWAKNSYTVKIQCVNPSNTVSSTAAYFDVWYSDDATVQTNKTSLSVSKKYGDTIYFNNVRPYYSYYNIKAVTGAISDGNGQYHYTLNENSNNYVISITTSRKEYTVSYNANGGSDAPANQTKYGGVTLTLSSDIPTRDGYTFVKWNTKADGTGTDYNPSASYSTNAALSLYAIWVASSSTITLANNTREVGQSLMIYINKISSTATHTITYSIGNQNGTICTKTSDDEVTWTIPSSVVSQIPGYSGECTISCTTFINNTQSGVPQDVQLLITVPSTYQPSISLTVVKVNSNTTVNGWGILLQGYSQVRLTASATMATGASLESLSFSGPGVSYVGTNTEVTSSILDVYGKIPWTVTVTDSRGRTATANWDHNDFEIYAYQAPSISSAATQRTDNTGVASTGNFLKSKAKLAISSANGHNAIVLHKVEYKSSTSSSWTLGDDTMVSNTWTSPYGGGAIDPIYAYNIRFTLSDSLGNSVTSTLTVPGISGIGLGLKNDRLRLGGIPTKAGLQVDWSAEFNGITRVNSFFDVKRTRCAATIPASSVGWYRVCSYNARGQANANGGFGFSIDVTLTEQGRETHKITLCGIYTACRFDFEQSARTGSTVYFDKIRYTTNSSNGYGYIDVHFNSTSSRSVGCRFDFKSRGIDENSYFSAIDFTAVADSPANETVRDEYTFGVNGFYASAVYSSGTLLHDLVEAGTEITSSSNLNSYKTPGAYSCLSGTIASSLTNSPVTSAFKLIVMKLVVAERLMQFVFPNTTDFSIYVRYYGGSSWTAWKTFTLT